MDIITTSLPIFESGYVVAELTVHVRPCFDQRIGAMLGDPYLASDVMFEDMQGDRHSFDLARTGSILAEIKRDQPRVWAEIEAAATARTNPSLAA